MDMGRNHSKVRSKQNKVAAAIIDAKPMEKSFPVLSKEKEADIQVGNITGLVDSGSTSHHATVTRVSQDGHGLEDKKRSSLTALPQVESPRSTMDVPPAEDILARLLMDNALQTIDGPLDDRKGLEECARAGPRLSGRDFAAGTDGYVSFSESESDITFSRVGVDSASHGPASPCPESVLPAKPKAANVAPDKGFAAEESVAGTGSDKWDISEDSCDEREQQRGVLSTKSGAQSSSKGSIVGGFEFAKPGAVATGGSSKDGYPVLQESQAKVVVDQLGRRVNTSVPTRGSSSSSLDKFSGWGDDTDGEKEEQVQVQEQDDDMDDDDDEDEMEDDDGEVYDWTMMDSTDGELGSARNQQETDLSGENALSTSTSRAKVDANPLGSKLGLTSTAEARRVRVISGPQQGGPSWNKGRGRGLGRGLVGVARGGKPVIPGRGGRPLYTPLMQGHVQQVRASPRPPSRVGGVASGAGSGGSNTAIAVLGGEESSAVGVTRPSSTTPVAGAHFAAPGPVYLGAASVSPASMAANAAIASSAVPSLITQRSNGSTTRALEGDRTLSGGATTPLVSSSSGATAGLQDGGGPRVTAGITPVVALPERGGAGTGTASALTPGSQRSHQLTVKDTANVTRKKAQLPQREQLEHPAPVGGSWIKNRHIVNNFILLDPLGTGSYAEVRLAKEKTSNKLYAMKIMNKDFLKKRQVGKEGTFMDSIRREIAIMKKVNHPNVLRLYEVMDDPKVNKLYLVLEFCKKGDLMKILNGDARALTCDPMNDTDVWYIMRQVVQGLNFLHQQNIVHGDIKPQNLLVGADNVAKIADFGISKMVQGSAQRLHEQVGTPAFMSPEICSGGEYSGQLADVWALGATMFMIRCGRPPFVANQVLALYGKIQNDPLEPPPEVNMSPGLWKLLQLMMQKEPHKRMKLDQVVLDPWIRRGDYGPARDGTPTTPSTVGPIPSKGAILPPPAAAAHVGSAMAPTTAAAAAAATVGTISPKDSRGQRTNEHNAAFCGASEEEVRPSAVDRGTSTIGRTASVVAAGANADAGAGPSVGGNEIFSRNVVGSVPRDSPAAQRSMSPSAQANPKQAITTTIAAAGQPRCSISQEGITTIPRVRGRGHLTEKEESWKYRSFARKKIVEENGSEARFRASVPVSGGGNKESRLYRSGEAVNTITNTVETSTKDREASTPASPEGSPGLAEDDGGKEEDEEDNGSDEFSSDDLDTLFERECSASTLKTSVRSEARAEEEEEEEEDSRGSGGDGGALLAGRRPDSRPKRLNSIERFDAVMDTLAAQTRPSRLGNNSSGTKVVHGNSGQGCPPLVGPLKDLSLKDVIVTSSPAARVWGACNEQLGLIAAASQSQGRRPSQEDRITVAPSLAHALAAEGKVAKPHLYHHYGFFGVFDGHNGSMCSEALCRGLHVTVAKQALIHQSPGKALLEAFDSFDKELCSRQEQDGDTSGSTGLVVLFDGLSRGLTVANVGDSRCVASRTGVAMRLTTDHRLSRHDERQRVTSNGCFVANNRINGVLAISRSFGDVQHKVITMANLEGESPGLIATPEISSESCCTSELEFVILATDGLWDVVDDQEAVNFLRIRLSENGDLSVAAKKLAKLALDEGSVDNVSVVVVWFQDGSGGNSEAEALSPTPSSLLRCETVAPSPSTPLSPFPQD